MFPRFWFAALSLLFGFAAGPQRGHPMARNALGDARGVSEAREGVFGTQGSSGAQNA